MSFELTIERWAWPGLGLGYAQDKACFVAAALPGERLLLEPIKEGKTHLEARILKVLEPSPDRIEPACPHFPECGGCALLHLAYEKQLVIKAKMVKELYKRQGIESEVGLVPSPEVWHYRHKTRLQPAGKGLGLSRYRSNSSLAVPQCKIISKPILVAAQGLSPKGDLALIQSKSSGQVAALWCIGNKTEPLKGFGQSVTEDYGFGALELKANLFAQANPFVTAKILSNLAEAMKGSRFAVEHFAGAGTLTLVLASVVGDFLAFEGDPKTAQLGTKNLERAGYITSRIEAAPATSGIDSRADLLLVDPPRSGLGNPFIEQILASKLSKLVYLSCDPQTQARDLSPLIAGGFRLQSLTGYDMYAHAGHLEALAILVR